MRHEPGSTVVLHEVWKDTVWAARPLRVVQDDQDLTALWFPRGTRWQAPTTPAGREREPTRAERLSTCAIAGEWAFVEHVWEVDTLQLLRPGDWHAVWVSWLPSGEHWGWYVNLQEPFERTARGFRTIDLVLDVIVDPDLRWRWKDEDELAVFVERGIIDAPLERRICEEALRVIADAEARRAPFGEGWQAWRPDPAWPLPQLPPGWDECP